MATNFQAPLVSRDALVEELKALHKRWHRTRDTLLYARLERELPSITVDTNEGPLPFVVRTAECELELRAALVDGVREGETSSAGDPHGRDPVVVLVDFDLPRVPADLLGRVATGKVLRIAGDRVLRAVFSGAHIAQEVLRARALCEAIRSESEWTAPAPPGGTVTEAYAWRAWLERRGVFESASETDLSLLSRVATQRAPEGFAKILADRPALARDLSQWLARAIGPLAPAWLALWLRSEGTLAASVAFALDAVRASLGREDFVDGIVRSRLDELLASIDAKSVSAEQWADYAERLATHWAGRDAALRAIFDEAERWLPSHSKVTEVAASSRFLRTSLGARQRELASTLDRARTDGGERALVDARVALERLGEHHAREVDASARATFERARMALRLLGWLLLRSRRPADDASEAIVLQERAEDYVRNGAWVDWARSVARGAEEDELAAAVQRVVEAVDHERDADDRAFSRALISWVELGRSATQRLVPIESALERFACGFLARRGADERAATRRLAVIVLDGMSWANCVELLESLTGAGYFPLRFNGQRTDRGAFAPVIAALPTITEVSRSALLSGRLLDAGEALDSSKDVARFESHARLRALNDGARPTLLLKRTLQTASGDASSEALDAMSSDRPVVGVVVNAIDDQLKAGRQMRIEYTLDAIRPLRALLDRATLAQRAILLVADHGHVSGARMTRTNLARSDDGGSRWRAIKAKEHASASELVVGSPYVWRPKGATHLALLVGETDTHGVVPGAGEHGGASMAEVIAPAVLIGSETLPERVRSVRGDLELDGDLEAVVIDRPPWWSVDKSARSLLEGPAKPHADHGARGKSAAPSPQLALPSLANTPPSAPVATAAAPQRAPSKWTTFFERSKALGAMGIEKLDPRWVAIIEALAEEGGALAPDRIASRTGVIASRVEGLVARMSELFNADGSQVLRFDAGTKLVHLDLALLEEIFR
ncbi:MAG: BREX-2 system phosphatase PglZ [Myxococcales bacterium]|nr:BREX-2 system phosphatase PglZ [Myxococcales bacterium]